MMSSTRNLAQILATAAIACAGSAPCTTISACAYHLLNQRASANQAAFFVYLDADSAFNHGFASGLFFSNDVNPMSAVLDAACVDSAGSPTTGCSSDPNALDQTRGTVFRFSFPALGPSDFIGLNFQDPEHYVAGDGTGGYNLTPATAIKFDVRSPSGAIVQFGVGGCVTGFLPVTTAWQTVTIPLNTLHPPPGGTSGVCPPDITNTHILFTVATNGAAQPAGGTVLLDNIEFVPTPTRQLSTLSLLLSTQTFGIVPRTANPVPSDQANRNIAAIYEEALTILTLLHRGQGSNVANALHVADTLDYALHHDNQGDPIPLGSDGSTALHNAYMAGDIAQLNSQGEVRLAGFSGGTTLCGPTGFCLVLDGATGGNNAWAMLAFIAAYFQSGKSCYLKDAETIGAWIIDQLQDRSTPSFGGYFVGFNDSGPGGLQLPNKGKSTENNGDIFAAFRLLSQIAAAQGNAVSSQKWLTAATIAGDFVKAMAIPGGGFYVGTVTVADASDSGKVAGNCAVPTREIGNDALNACEFLDSNTFTLLPMAGATAYSSIDWVGALQHVVNYSRPDGSYKQSVTAGGQVYQGFDLVPAPPSFGVTFEFTGQMSATCAYLDALMSISTFQNCASTYLSQIQTAQASAPFTDGYGLVASVLQNGDSLDLASQCVQTPFQCIPERVGLAATNWAILADQQFNPMAYAGAIFSTSQFSFPTQTVGSGSTPMSVSVTNAGTAAMIVSGVLITGANANDFAESDNCVSHPALAPGASCTVTIRFLPAGSGDRRASLTLKSNGFAMGLALEGSASPVDDFSTSITPTSQSVRPGDTVAYTISTKAVGSPQAITFSVSGLPAGVSAVFSPNPINAGGTTTLAISTTLGTIPLSTPLTILGAGTEVSHLTGATILIEPVFGLSISSITFPSQNVGVTSAPQQLTITNPSNAPVPVALLITGRSSGEFTQTSDCPTTLSANGSCAVTLTFTPSGTGPRAAALLIRSGQAAVEPIPLDGIGKGTCLSIGKCAVQLLTQRVTANQNAFFVYQDADSGFNHGFPIVYSGGGASGTVVINTGCIDSLTSISGCSGDPNAMDLTRGTVLSITFPGGMIGLQFAGVAFVEPSNYISGDMSAGYNLAPSATLTFDARAPLGANVQFGVGNCVTPYVAVQSRWTTIRVDPASLLEPGTLNTPCLVDFTSVHTLFTITADATLPAGGPVLLDNIRLATVPISQKSRPSLPLSTQTFGVAPALNYPIPTDQVNRNLATTYEAAMTALALFSHGQNTTAATVVDGLDYALHHDNHGDSIPLAGALTGLHSAYEAGDLAFLNNQAPSMGIAQAGDARLSGFSASNSLCGATQFCLVLDGATGGNNAWAIMAFATAYVYTGKSDYLQDAESIGNWVVSELTDKSSSGYGGYFLGYSDGGTPKQLLLGKSTEQNAEIFAAFHLLEQIEEMRGNSAASAVWASAAKIAGDFVVRMFDGTNGRFNTGTVDNIFTTGPGPGICLSTTQVMGADTVNTCDFITANTIPTLALSGIGAYNIIDWSLPIKYLSTFSQAVTAAGTNYQGFGLVPSADAAGVGWEFTSQAIAAYQTGLIPNTSSTAGSYVTQVLSAQNSAPFGDGLGLVAATLPSGDTVAAPGQCINTPFQCIPERVGLAPTAWASFADQGMNPLMPATSPVAVGVASVTESAVIGHGQTPGSLFFQPELGRPVPSKSLLLTNSGTVPVGISISLAGTNPKSFSTHGCTAPLEPAASCSMTVFFNQVTVEDHTALLLIEQTPSWANRPQRSTIRLFGGSPRRDHM